MSARRATSLLAASLLATGVAVTVSTPAFAKSSIALRADARSVTVGRPIHLTAVGTTDDLGGAPIQLCVDERAGQGPWRVVGCGHEGTLRLSVRAWHPGVVTFRAELIGRNAQGHLVVDRVSPPVAVRVR